MPATRSLSTDTSRRAPRSSAIAVCNRSKCRSTPISTLEYITGSDYESSEVAELTEDEMSVSVFDGEAIDVDEIVKEQILLAVPTRMLCREDCKGICPECGTDRNTGECNCVTE